MNSATLSTSLAASRSPTECSQGVAEVEKLTAECSISPIEKPRDNWGKTKSPSPAELESFWELFSQNGLEKPEALIIQNPKALNSPLQLFLSTSTSSRRSSFCSTGSTVYLYCLDADQGLMVFAQLAQIKKYASKGELQKAMVAVYDAVRGLLADKKYDDCDKLLELLNSQSLPGDVALSFFMATASTARELLPARQAAYDVAVQRIQSEGNNEILEAIKMCK